MFRTICFISASALVLPATAADAVTFAYTGSVQQYSVVTTGKYALVAAGAAGGEYEYHGFGGQGIAIGAYVMLSAGTILDIVVGGKGGSRGGGGGGSFVLAGLASPIVIGGGGGGGSRYGFGQIGSGAAATSNQTGTNGGGTNGTGGTGGLGGMGGNGGTTLYPPQPPFIFDSFGFNGGGGGGLNSDGAPGAYGHSSTGGYGGMGFGGGMTIWCPGLRLTQGGFGGGGGGGCGGGGGGGGYSGGGGGGEDGGGGGGGSFTRADATDVTATANLQADGNGFASIDLLAATVPEPATWGLLTAGFGIVGAAMRRRKTQLA